MVDAGQLTSILDAARSEIKRWGGEYPTLTHAAFVFARRWPSLFEDVFGADGRVNLEALLGAQKFRGDEGALRAILEEHDLPGSLRAIHAELVTDLAADPTRAESADASSPSRPDLGQRVETREPAEDEGALSERSSRVVQVVRPAANDLREMEAREVAVQALRGLPAITALIGERGVGRTSTLSAVARQLATRAEAMPVLRLAPDTITANPTSTLRMVLDDLTRPSVIAIDDLDQLARLGSDNPDRELLALIEASRFHPMARIVLILEKRFLSRLSVTHQTLHDDLVRIQVPELPPEVTEALVHDLGTRFADDRGLDLDVSVVHASLTPPVAADGSTHPGLALSRIDLACARAMLAGDTRVSIQHLGPDGNEPAIGAESRNLALVLASKVKGQQDAVERVAQRLTLTRANLDLRPERPNGVFLFVGPTGVGKTELAKEIAVHEYGGPDRLIRLDMSEFAHDWAISRLVGPMPGYVGSTEPESWLTTKVLATPQCVILLDEIEKAHPRVWNTFLQVFDSGRLTDSRGMTADFSEAVVVMTSNLGVQEAASRAVGFSGRDDVAARDRLLATVREQMAPELLNRMDDIIVFSYLSMDAIVQIAHQELDEVRSRLSAAGWSVDYDHAVADWLARTGYDPAYGARHLQRNIEKELLTLLAKAPSRQLAFSVQDGALTYRPA